PASMDSAAPATSAAAERTCSARVRLIAACCERTIHHADAPVHASRMAAMAMPIDAMIDSPRAKSSRLRPDNGETRRSVATDPPFTHFIVAPGSAWMIELYHNTGVALPDYRAVHPLQAHLAFSVEDVPAEHDRLLRAGASSEQAPHTTDSGDQFAMLRDPWG